MTQTNTSKNLNKKTIQKIKKRKNMVIISLIIAVVILAADIILVIAKSNDVTLKSNATEILKITQSGTKLNPIIVNGNGGTVQCIKVEGNYITVRNFVVTDCESHAILILGNNVIVENNVVRNSVTENGKGECFTEGSWGSGIKLGLGSHDVTVRGNKVHENCGEGIASTRSFNVLIENNQVWDNFSVGIYVDNSYNVKVSNNLVYCTGVYLRDGKRPNGIAFAEESYEGWGLQRRDNSAVNNKVNGCNTGIASWKSEEETGKEVRLLIEGNQVFNSTGRSIELNTVNEDVIVRNNTSDKPAFVRHPEGVTLVENIEGIATPFFQATP